MNSLLLDAGNSYLKWRFVSNKIIKDGGLTNEIDPIFQINKIITELSYTIESCLLSSVRSHCITRQYLDALVKLNIPFIKTPKPEVSSYGVSLTNTNHNCFGVDRWLALIAARNYVLDGPLLIIDCGTAVSLDFLDSDGVFDGSWILPGFNTAYTALTSKASELKKYSGNFKACSMLRGFNTVEAINTGIVTMICATIEYAIATSKNQLTTFLTGGDALIAANKLDIQPLLIKKNLVLDGLMLINSSS